MSTDEGMGEKSARIVMLLLGCITGAPTIGPALLAAVALYGAMWLLAPRIGRLWAWPWLAAGSLVIVAGAITGSKLGVSDIVEFTLWPVGAVIDGPVFVACWLWAQVALALLMTGTQIILSGWPAVRRGAVPKSEKDKHGNYRVTPQKQKVKLDPYADEIPVAPQQVPEEPPTPKIKLALSEDTQEEPEFDQMPAFADDEGFTHSNYSQENSNV